MKKVYRTEGKDRMIAGVLGGLGEYFNVDATLLRVFYVAITFVSGIFPGLLTYLFAIIIIPTKSSLTHSYVVSQDEDKEK